MVSKKPKLDRNINLKNFLDFYWLKSELQEFCRMTGLPSTGGKFDLVERIKTFLAHGLRIAPSRSAEQNKSSSIGPAFFSLDTKAEKNFRCSREVRNFFEREVGKQFHFSVRLQNFIKANPGVTFRQIIEEWNRQRTMVKSGEKFNIPPQFEYNQFTRDFFADPQNKDKTRKDCVTAWKEVRIKRGDRKYKPRNSK